MEHAENKLPDNIKLNLAVYGNHGAHCRDSIHVSWCLFSLHFSCFFCFKMPVWKSSHLHITNSNQTTVIFWEIAASASACMCLLCFYFFNECAGLKRVTDGGSTTELFMGPGLGCDWCLCSGIYSACISFIQCTQTTTCVPRGLQEYFTHIAKIIIIAKLYYFHSIITYLINANLKMQWFLLLQTCN